MVFISSSVYFVQFKTFGKIAYHNCVTLFSLRRIIATISLFISIFIHSVILIFFRLVDEIFYRKYKKVVIKKPIYIISNPRCGTTFLHRLMTLDSEQYSYMDLYHTIYPAVSFIRLVDNIGKIDRKIGRPFRRLFDWLDTVLFDGWKDIHPMGFNKTEEDEGIFAVSGITPGLMLFCPQLVFEHYLDFLDKQDSRILQHAKNFYLSSLQRFVYATRQEHKTLLVKNVFSSGRIEWLQTIFPDIRFIYPVRNPVEAIPSVVSMFTTPWRLHSPDITENSIFHRTFAKLCIQYYAYFFAEQQKIDASKMISFTYDSFIENPTATVISIYRHFRLPLSQQFLEILEHNSKRSKAYKSKHSYSLAQYGLTKKDILIPLQELCDYYGFEQEEQLINQVG